MKPYARHRGCSPAAVRKALDRGQIERDADGMIDVLEADRRWPKLDTPDMREPGEPEVPSEETAELLDYGAARAAKETWLSRLRQLEFEEKSGILVRQDEVQSEWFRVCRVLRDRFLNLPDRLADQLAVEDNAAEIHGMLTRGIREVLEALASEVADDREEAA